MLLKNSIKRYSTFETFYVFALYKFIAHLALFLSVYLSVSSL